MQATTEVMPELEPIVPGIEPDSVPQNNLTPEAVDEAKLTLGIRDRAKRFIDQDEKATLASKVASQIKDKLAYDLSIKKAILLGNGGRDSEWGPFVESLNLVIRTVDRWVTKKLDSGQLPAWAATRLRANQQPEPPSTPGAKPLELLLVGLSDEQKTQFIEAMDKFVPEAFALLIFETVTTYPVALAPKVRKTLTYLDEHEVDPPTIVEKLEQQAAEGAAA